jgi:chitinase
LKQAAGATVNEGAFEHRRGGVKCRRIAASHKSFLLQYVQKKIFQNGKDPTSMELIADYPSPNEIRIPSKKIKTKIRASLIALGLLALTPAVATPQHNRNPACACAIPNGPPNPHPYLVGYLGVYRPADWVALAKTLDYTKMTHLNLAFINPSLCNGPCTAQSDMTLHANQTFNDEALKSIVDSAHQHGTKVLASLGGDKGDRTYMQFYNAGLSDQIADAVDAYVKKNNLDGVDVDIESPDQMGVPFTQFVHALVTRLRPEGKLVTAAVAQYIQAGVQDEVLQQFDIINVMIYGSYDRSVADMAWWMNSEHIPKEKLTLGIGFHNYSAILAAYPNAWAVDTVGGGTFRNGAVMNYQGEATVAKLTQLSAQYGGAMIWELSQDDPSNPHSLLKAIQKNLDPGAPRIPIVTPSHEDDWD